MPYKPTYRPFKPPPLRTPSFLPEPVYAESSIPEPQAGPQGPPPALQMPEVRVDAPVPERPRTMIEQYGELQQSRPEPIGGWRRPVDSFLRGGVMGLASELINPSREREVFKQKEDALLGGFKVQSQQRNNDLTEAYRNSQIEDTKARQEDRAEGRKAKDIDRQEHIANNRWQEIPAGQPTPLSTPGMENQWEYATIDGKKYRRPSEAATQASKREAEMATWREVPPAIAKELGLQTGTKVPAGELDGYLRMVEARAAREQSASLRRELAQEAAETRRMVAGMASSNRGSQTDFRNTMQMGNAYKSEKPIQALYEVKQAYDAMRNAGHDGPGDMAIMRYFAKITDPTTGVREGEYAEMARAGGIENDLNRFLSGKWVQGQRLSPQTRAAFLRISEQLVKNRQQAAAEVQNVYRRRAEKFGVDPRDIFEDQGPPPLESPASKSSDPLGIRGGK